MFEKTWRWFGPNDRIGFNDIRQAGATGIVTALHHIKVGEVWTKDEIIKRKREIELSGLRWSVVESVPVSEDIKKQTGDYLRHIENYKQTIRNLGQQDIKTICYNFMPILDWSRTNLVHKFPDGSESLRFELIGFAAFDLFILNRENAQNSYSTEVYSKAKKYFSELSEDQKEILKSTILLGLPGSLESMSLDEMKKRLQTYKHIDSTQLKKHLFYFLSEVIPVAEEAGVNMAIHPDDPPFSLLGLPRVVSSQTDIEEILSSVDSKHNGITFCTGSFGAGYYNNLPLMAEKFAERVHFAHLRNVNRDADFNFNENYLFEGDVDIYAVMKTLLLEMKRRKDSGDTQWQIPVRPDHGNQMLEDIGKDNYPGYSLYGRMKSLAEIKGMELGIVRSLNL